MNPSSSGDTSREITLGVARVSGAKSYVPICIRFLVSLEVLKVFVVVQ